MLIEGGPVRTHQQRQRNMQREWVTTLTADDKLISCPLMSDGYKKPVATMSESTVVVYYQCDPIGKQKTSDVKMRGARRVVAFCLLTAAIPMMLIIIPLYLRNSVFAERYFSMLESDVLPLDEGLSNIFCQGHNVKAQEGWFSAFQMPEEPGISNERREATIERKMVIPDDRLEYWGFHLLPQSTLKVAVCASSPGARLLVVRGEKNLELCGLLQPSLSAEATTPTLVANDEETPQVTFEEMPAMSKPDDPDEVENVGAEVTDGPSLDDEEVPKTAPTSSTPKHVRAEVTSSPLYDDEDYADEVPSSTPEPSTPERRRRHSRSRLRAKVTKRDVANRTQFDHLSNVAHFEGAIEHGGNADMNFTEQDGGSSVSSFEAGLLTCFQGKTLFQKGFEAGGKTCESKETWTGSMHLSQTIKTEGHFYYVFYSDNDLDVNQIKARFQINSTRFNFATAAHAYRNTTECSFKKNFFGGEGRVFVEADSDVELISTCEPRIMIYLLFPVSALVFVLIFGLI